MEAKQIIPRSLDERSNYRLYYQRIAHAGIEILAYAASKMVVILAQDLRVIQILTGFQEDVRDISVDQTGKIAVVEKNVVIIFSYSIMETAPWKEVARIENSFELKSICLSPDGKSLACGGSHLSIWQLYPNNHVVPKPKPTLTQNIPLSSAQSVVNVIISPDSRFIATYGANDRLVKVWYVQPERGLSFSYLAHPRAVNFLSWRNSTAAPGVFERNVLLTRCSDGETRIWAENESSRRLQFSLLHSIDSAPHAVLNWLVIPQDSNQKNEGVDHDVEIFSKDRSCDTRLLSPQLASKDWIVGTHDDGSVMIWTVSNLTKALQHSVVSLRFHLKNVFDSRPETRKAAIIAHPRRFASDEGEMYPAIIKLYAASLQGDVSSWDLIMDDNRDSSPSINPKEVILPSARSFGHRGEVVRVVRHRTLPLVATLDDHGMVVAWFVNDTSASDTHQILSDVAVFKAIEGEDVRDMTWDAKDSVLFILGSKTGVISFFVPVNIGVISQRTSISASPQVKASKVIGDILNQRDSQRASRILSLMHPKKDKCLIVVILDSDAVYDQEVKVFDFNFDKPSLKISLEISDSIEIEADEKITCACYPLSLHLEDSAGNHPQACSFITGGSDGCICLWAITIENSAVNTSQLCKFKGAEGPIEEVVCSSFGRLAALSGDVFNIWELETSPPHYHFEGSIDLRSVDSKTATEDMSRASLASPLLSTAPNVVTDSQEVSNIFSQKGSIFCDWLSLSEGSELILLGRGRHVSVFSQKSDSVKSKGVSTFDAEWVEIVSNVTPLSMPVTGVVWTRNDGAIVAATKEHVQVFTKWFSNEFAAEATYAANSARTIGDLFCLANEWMSPYPPYHPRLLIECLMAGQFERIGAILKNLYLHLKNQQSKVVNYIDYLSLKDFFSYSNIKDAPSQNLEEDAVDISTLSKKKVDIDGDEFKISFSDDSDSETSSESDDAPVVLSPTTPVKQSNDDKYGFLGGFGERKVVDIDDDVKISLSSDESDSDDDKTERFYSSESEDESSKKKASKKAKEKLPIDQGKVNKEKSDDYASSTSLFETSSAAMLISADECLDLVEFLTEKSIPSVSSREQIYLLAIVETFAKILAEGKGLADRAAVKFVLMNRVFTFISRSLPPHQRPTQMSWLEMAWALHAEGHPALMKSVLSPAPLWGEVRSLGIPLWNNDHPALVELAESVAKNHYLEKKDPNDAALYYVSMRKLTSLVRLFEIAEEKTIATFLKNDFTQPKYKTAALSNAYKLMSQHRFAMAATFFLIGDSLKNAVSICIEKLDDVMLALFIARLYEGSANGEVYRSILENTLLPRAKKDKELELHSMVLWLLGNYKESVEVLVPEVVKTTEFEFGKGFFKTSMKKQEIERPPLEVTSFSPGSLHFFEFLCKTRLIMIRKLNFDHLRAPISRLAIYSYAHNGCSAMAIDLFSRVLTTGSDKDRSSGIARDASKSFFSKLADQLIVQRVQTVSNFKTFNESSAAFELLMSDCEALATAIRVPVSDLHASLLEFLVSNDHIREHYFVLKYLYRMDDCAVLLNERAKRISALATRGIVENNLSSDQASKLESEARQLYQCLIDYNKTPDDPLTRSSSSVLSESVSSADLRKASFIPRKDMALTDQFTIIAAGRLGVFASAWSEGDFITMLELLHGKQVDQLTKPCVTPWKKDEANFLETSTSGRVQDEELEDDNAEDDAASGSNLALKQQMVDDKAPPISDSEIKVRLQSDSNRYLEQLFRLLILVKFTATMEQFLTANSIDDVEHTVVVERLRACQIHIETQLSLIPDQILYSSNFKQVSLKDLFSEASEASDDDVESEAPKRMRIPDKRPEFYLQLIRQTALLNTDAALKLLSDLSHNLLDDADAYNYLFNAEFLEQEWYLQRMADAASGISRLNDQEGDDEGSILTYGEIETVFKDKDPIGSFAINPFDHNVLAVATSRGIKEVRLNEDSFAVGNHSPNRSNDLTPNPSMVLSDANPLPPAKPAVSHSRSKEETHPHPLPSPQIGVGTGLRKHVDAAHAASVIAALSSPYSSSSSLSASSSSIGGKQNFSSIMCLESHPSEPFYLAGGNDGSVSLWQFGGGPLPVHTYRSGVANDLLRVHGIRFNAMGTKFGACDHSGKVTLWRWDDEPSSLLPYWSVQCHSGRTNDMAFLNHGSFFVTAGHSSSTTRKNVKFWDTLLPLSKANVWSIDALENGASCVVYSSRHQRVFVGDKGGVLCSIDVRQQRTLELLEKAHEANINTLTLDQSERYLYSASSDGSVKVWDIDGGDSTYAQNLKVADHWTDYHKTSALTSIRPLGGAPLSLQGAIEFRATGDQLISSGGDGRLLRRDIRY